MIKHVLITFVLMAAVFTSTGASALEKIEDQPLMTVSGTITKIDTVGYVVNVLVSKLEEMDFYVSGQTKISQNARDIGLGDLKVGDSVTIQYDASTPAKKRMISLVDNGFGK